MAARRLLIVMLVLLGISVLAGTLLPQQRAREGTETTETQSETTVRDTVPRGELREQTIRVSPDRAFRIEIDLGDQLLLYVRSRSAVQVEIPRLGLIETVDRFAPARFDVFATRPGSYPIRLVGSGRVVGVIVVSRRTKPGKD